MRVSSLFSIHKKVFSTALKPAWNRAVKSVCGANSAYFLSSEQAVKCDDDDTHQITRMVRLRNWPGRCACAGAESAVGRMGMGNISRVECAVDRIRDADESAGTGDDAIRICDYFVAGDLDYFAEVKG